MNLPLPDPPALPPRRLLYVSWRYLQRHIWQSLLMVLGIALGVAVVIAIDLANASASRAFDLSTQAVTGRTTHTISAGSQGLDQALYVDLRRAGLEVPMAPVLSAYVSSPQLGGVTLQLLGVDPFAEAPFRDYLVGAEGLPLADLTHFLVQPGAALLSSELAARYGLQPGDVFEIAFGGDSQPAVLSGLLQPEDALSRRALSSLLLVDIATAQEWTGRLGRLDRVDLILPPQDQPTRQAIQALLPAGVSLEPTQARSGIVAEMTAAFRLNLTALSLLALVVALFLIYNSMTFAVLQRRPLFGSLRCLGVTRREIFLMVISEAFLIGLLGAALGVLGGILLGRATVGLVSQTINDLFFVLTVREVPIPLGSLLKGAGLGLLATVLTAAFPAWEAASVPPRTALSRSGLESKTRRVLRALALLGLVLAFAGGAVLALPGGGLLAGFAGTFLVVIGLAMLTPLATQGLMALTSRLARWGAGPLGRMAPREVVNALSRTSIAIAALMVAVAVTIGVSLMVGSFRFTVVTWLDQILHGDVYISVPGASVSQPAYEIQPQVLAQLPEWPGVQRVDLLQTALVDSPAGPVQLSANNNPNDGLEQIYLSASHPPAEMWPALQAGEVLVSEPLANRLGLPRQGGFLELNTPQGLQRFPVAGIYYDYASTQGNAIMALDVYRRLWQDEAISAAALILAPGVDPQQLSDELAAALAGEQQLLIRPNQALRAETLEVFDRTFAITGALQLMTTLVAFVGVLSAMLSLQLDKQRQLGILKAIGLTARQLWGLIALETGLMGAVAGLLAMPTGYLLALILIYIINRRSFGWTLQMSLSPEPFLQALAVAVLAALLAGIYPAWRMMRRNTAEAIRFD